MATQTERERLEAALEEALTQLRELEKRLGHKGDYGLGKGDPAIYEWELNLARRQKAEEKVTSIREALRRLADGKYGICQSCQQRIDPARLEVLPYTEWCIKCAQANR